MPFAANKSMIRYEDVRGNPEILSLIEKADRCLSALGYTEHSVAHVCRVADLAGYILRELGYGEREVELVRIAAYLHDIGNLANRVDHAHSGAVMAFVLLSRMDMPMEDVADITSAIGNHHEETGVPVSALAAALILADKADVRRSRVRPEEATDPDIHDRVNYSVTASDLRVVDGVIRLDIEIDTAISSVADYFEIFLERMRLCRRAAKKLGQDFTLYINGQALM